MSRKGAGYVVNESEFGLNVVTFGKVHACDCWSVYGAISKRARF